MPYLSDPVTPEGEIRRVARGSARNQVSIAAAGDRMLIVLKGEPSVPEIVECLQEGLKDGWLDVSMRTLVDMTDFYGVVDWTSLGKLRAVTNWASDARERSRVAYLVRNREFQYLIRAVSAMFDHTQHQGFTDRAEAVAWLLR